MATDYRAVCPRCTAYIRSPAGEDESDWLARADKWLRVDHQCRRDMHTDGIEDLITYSSIADPSCD